MSRQKTEVVTASVARQRALQKGIGIMQTSPVSARSMGRKYETTLTNPSMAQMGRIGRLPPDRWRMAHFRFLVIAPHSLESDRPECDAFSKGLFVLHEPSTMAGTRGPTYRNDANEGDLVATRNLSHILYDGHTAALDPLSPRLPSHFVPLLARPPTHFAWALSEVRLQPHR
jgi:hypothetical protein